MVDASQLLLLIHNDCHCIDSMLSTSQSFQANHDFWTNLQQHPCCYHNRLSMKTTPNSPQLKQFHNYKFNFQNSISNATIYDLQQKRREEKKTTNFNEFVTPTKQKALSFEVD